jgi:hypothetical protein
MILEIIGLLIFAIIVLAIFAAVIYPMITGNTKGIVLDEKERSLRFVNLKKKGKFYVHGDTAYMPHLFWIRERWNGLKVKRYLILRESDPRPLVIAEGNFVPVPMDSAMLSGAIRSDIVTRFLKGGMDWKIVIIVVLVFVVIVTAVT